MIRTARARPCAMLVLAISVLTTCDTSGSDRDTDSGFATWDSAGFTIAENTDIDPAGVATWSVDTAPSITIGVSMGDSAYELTSIGGVRQLPNGMIVVLNGQGEAAFEFRFYDSTGKHIATHGRRGQGPGEYRWINFFGPAGGDTVIGVDFPNGRLNWVSASAGYLRSTRLDENRIKKLLGDDASGTIEGMVPLGDSLYAVKAFRHVPGAASPARLGTSFHIVDLAANTTSDLVRYDDPPLKVVQLSSGPTHLWPMGAGNSVHVVDRARRRICAANSSAPEISCIDSHGKRLSIRWRSETVPYTDDDRRAYEASFRKTRLTSRRTTAADVEAMLAATDWPERHNPFTVLQIDAEGNFWILEYALDEWQRRDSRFRVLDPEGRHIAFADPFPARNAGLGSTVHIGTSSVLRVFEDADGVPMVGVFRIRKPG